MYISKGANKKVNYYSFPTIKKERWRKGAKTKYDIPQYIEGIPEGFAIFCTTKEAGKVRKYQEQIEKKNKNNKNELEHKKLSKKEINEEINRDVEDMDVVNKRIIAGAMKMEENDINNNDENKKKDDDENNKDVLSSDELEEPIPRNDHKYCHICKTKFEKYIKHIKCYSHFENLQRNQNFFNRFKKSFERILNFWDIKNGRIIKNTNSNSNNKDISGNTNININKLLSPMKSDEVSTKEGSFQDKHIISNIINMLNNGNNNNNENINNNYNNVIRNNNYDINIKNTMNNLDNTPNNNTTNNNIMHINTTFNNINLNNRAATSNKKILNNSNIDLNKSPKNFNIQNNNIKKIYNNLNKKKSEIKNNNKIFTPFTPTADMKRKYNYFHMFNLTYNNTIISNNKNIFKNENNNKIRTINYISINNKKDEENSNNNFNKMKEKKIQFKKDEKDVIQPQKKFVTKCFPKFTLQTYELTRPKKRKKNELYKGGDIFVISTPKKIEYDYFPILSIDNPKKLLNKNIVYFQ